MAFLRFRGRFEPLVAAAAASGMALASSEDQLLHASVYTRHGARTPLSSVPGLPIPESAYVDKPEPSQDSPVVDTRNVIVRAGWVLRWRRASDRPRATRSAIESCAR